MKSFKKYLLIAVLLSGFVSIIQPGHAAALTDAQMKSCFNTWVGSYWPAGTSTPPPAGTFDKTITKKQANTFKNGSCNKDNGGNCWFGIPAAGGQNYAGQQIHCTGADGKDYVSGTYNQGGTTVSTGRTGGSAASLADCKPAAGYDPDPAMCCITDEQINANPDLCKQYACKDAKNCNLTAKYINPIINKFLAPLAILAVIIGVIWGAIQYITSAGDASKVAEGKSKIQKALFGLLAFVFLYALLNWLIPGGLL